MDEFSLFAMPRRLAAEGEVLIVHNFPRGMCGLASVEDVRRYEQEVSSGSFWQRTRRRFQHVPDRSLPVCVPSGAYVILKGISGAIQQKYGLESEEGAVFLQTATEVDGSRSEVRFNNGVQIRLRELRAGVLLEVLSLARTNPALYEQELQTL